MEGSESSPAVPLASPSPPIVNDTIRGRTTSGVFSMSSLDWPEIFDRTSSRWRTFRRSRGTRSSRISSPNSENVTITFGTMWSNVRSTGCLRRDAGWCFWHHSMVRSEWSSPHIPNRGPSGRPSVVSDLSKRARVRHETGCTWHRRCHRRIWPVSGLPNREAPGGTGQNISWPTAIETTRGGPIPVSMVVWNGTNQPPRWRLNATAMAMVVSAIPNRIEPSHCERRPFFRVFLGTTSSCHPMSPSSSSPSVAW